jgi:hypothetical protein
MFDIQKIKKMCYCINIIEEKMRNMSIDLNSSKAAIYDRLFALATGGEYVNKVGYDVIVQDKKISLKTKQKMFTGKGTVEVILAKKFNESLRQHEIDYDIIVFIQSRKPGVAIATIDSVKKMMIDKPYGVVIKIPNSHLEFLVQSSYDLSSEFKYIPTRLDVSLENLFNDIALHYWNNIVEY